MEGDEHVDKAEVKLEVSSEAITELFCEECQEEGKQSEADWFCNDCEEYLCADCITVHRKTRLTRHHILLDKDSMPRKKIESLPKLSHDSCTEVCPDHRAELIKYYCDDHDGFACGVCIAIKHRNCEGISYIPQVAEELETSDDFLSIVTELHVINQQYKQLNQDAIANTLKVKDYSDSAVKAVREIKDQIYTIFELLEHCVQEETEQTKARDMEKINSLLSKSQCGVEDSQQLLIKINELQDSKRLCRLFGFMKEIKKHVGALRSDLVHSTELNTIKQYEFKATAKVKEILRSPSGIGHIVYHEKDTGHDETNHEYVNVKERSENNSYEIGSVSTLITTCADCDKAVLNESKIDRNSDSEVNDKKERAGSGLENKELPTKHLENKYGKEYETSFNHTSRTDIRDQSENKETPVDIGQGEGMGNDNEIRHDTYSITVNDEVYNVAEKDNADVDDHERNTSPSGVMAEHFAELKIKCKDDSMTPYISGLSLMPSHVLLLCDFNNSKLKVFDNTLGILVNDLQLAHGPWGIVRSNSDQVAVTIPYMNRKLLIKIESTLVLTKQREISVKGNCRGIAYKDSRLFVSFTSPPKVEVIGMDGLVINTVLGEGRAANTLSLPYHLIVNPDDDIIYVSNSNGNDVISFTLCGDINAACQDLKYPRGMCFDSRGFIYVCARDSHMIHVLTPECRKVKILLNQKSGLRLPMSVYMDQSSKQLYVGMEEDFIKVYQLT